MFEEVECKGIGYDKWAKANYAICRACFDKNAFTIYSTISKTGTKTGITNLARHIANHHKSDKPVESKESDFLQKHIIHEKSLPNKLKEKLTYAATIGLAIGNRPYNMLNDLGFRYSGILQPYKWL